MERLQGMNEKFPIGKLHPDLFITVTNYDCYLIIFKEFYNSIYFFHFSTLKLIFFLN